MNPIAVFYHCKLSGEGIPNEDHAIAVMSHQMFALKQSGLADAAAEIHIGVNGSDSDGLIAGALAPERAILHIHGTAARTEIPTQKILRNWLAGRDGWYVLYHHTKGVTHPGDINYQLWRENMEKVCVWNWRRCVEDLAHGYDISGAHWLTPERYGAVVSSPFFGGTFWWATAKYLKQLPPLPDPTWANRFEAESWIGKRRPYPVVRDYSPYWPI